MTYNGEPVAGAEIAFSPVADGGKSARGRSGEDGSFVMVTTMSPSFTDRGVAAGDYKVTVIRTPSDVAEEGAIANPVLDGPPTDEQIAAMSGGQDYGKDYENLKPGERPKVKSDLPQKYTDFDTSPIQVTVVTGPNELDLALVD